MNIIHLSLYMIGWLHDVISYCLCKYYLSLTIKIMASSLKFTNQNLDLLQKKETSTRNNQVSPKMIADNCTVAGKYAKSGCSSRNYDNGRNSQRYDTEAGKVQNTGRKFKLDFKDYSLMHWKVRINRFGMGFFSLCTSSNSVHKSWCCIDKNCCFFFNRWN